MPPEPVVLAFDASAAHCAAAVLSGTGILAHRHAQMATGQAEALPLMVSALLTEAGLDFAALTHVGVGTGPGNFTGIRIAVAYGRGLAMALGIPARGISRLVAQAEGLAASADAPVLSLLDGRRDQFYAQRIAGPREPAPPRLVDLAVLTADPALLAPRVVGHRAVEIAAAMGGMALEASMPLAVAIGRLAAASGEGTAARPAPLYVRPADAAPSRHQPPPILP